MSFKEVKELRKTGRLDEAFNLAKSDLESDTLDIWNKRSIAWVFYDYIKKNNEPDQYEDFCHYLDELIALELPEEEKMIFENLAWKLGKMVFALGKSTDDIESYFDTIFDKIRNLPFPKPEKSYSYLFKSFLNKYQNWGQFVAFAIWWDYDNFLPEDYLMGKLPNGKSIMSLVERSYIAFAKGLLENPKSTFGTDQTSKEIKDNFLKKLDNLIEKHPDYTYPDYYKAKLLLLSDSKEEAFKAVIPFARRKRNDFWIWDILSDVVETNEEKIACITRGLLCKTKEDFLVKLREKLAALLIQEGLHNEAKTEIQLVIKTREEKLWKISDDIKFWTEEEWYKNATVNESNRQFYKMHSNRADDLLFSDIPEEIAVVEFVNKNKSILNFIISKNKHGYFKYDRFFESVNIGNCLKVRLEKEGNEGYYLVLTAKKEDCPENSDILKSFHEELKIHHSGNFGFVGDVHVGKQFIYQHNLMDGQNVKGKAILSFNKKKNEWGWKTVFIES